MEHAMKHPSILVTGGAGYVGSALVPRLLHLGYRVRVLDLFWYGREALASCVEHPRLELIEGDLRDRELVNRAVGGAGEGRPGVDAVLHLACISNDPSFELAPTLGRSINLDSFPGLVEASLRSGVKRFIYASSSSIYGVKKEPRVQEDASPDPLTDYSRFKLQCEQTLLEMCSAAGGPEATVPIIVRPATVCGYAPRLRLDLTVNILTAHALERGLIRVFGGSQLRPNLHIKDMVAAYECLLEAPAEKVHGEAFNIGYENFAVGDIADKVRSVLAAEGSQDKPGAEVEIRVEPSDDLRSYHIDSSKVRRVLGFIPRHTLEDAVRDLAAAYRAGKIMDPLENPRYHNIRRMKEILGG
ncbi:MAG: SDR family oxidoreductase [Deltaproteobacteria bacterium]|nr:SDR family oxidoreductase [Deltaproteobacteria bacterium]